MLTLYQNAQLTINADADLTVASNIQSKGTITVLSSSTRSGSLIANGYSSTGTTTTDVSGADDGITYNKYVNAVGSPGWDMIGSPVFGETFTDIIGSLALLMIFAPVIAVFWFLVRRDGGPGFYGQQRVGRAGCIFTCWKLRSMCTGAEQHLTELIARDPAIAAEWLIEQKLQNDTR